MESRHLNIASTKINLALGSCHDSSRLSNDSSIFRAIMDKGKPDLFIWLGDAVYLDRGLKKKWDWNTLSYQKIERTEDEKRERFDLTKIKDREY